MVNWGLFQVLDKKIEKMINSCENHEHREATKKYIRLAKNKLLENICYFDNHEHYQLITVWRQNKFNKLYKKQC